MDDEEQMQKEAESAWLAGPAGFDWLDSREFYELMQAYRHDPIGDAKMFEKIKAALRENFYLGWDDG